MTMLWYQIEIKTFIYHVTLFIMSINQVFKIEKFKNYKNDLKFQQCLLLFFAENKKQKNFYFINRKYTTN